MNLSSSVAADQDIFMFRQACELQDQLMTTFLSMVSRSSGTLLLRSMLRQTLENLAKLSAAEESSFFWLDDQGYVIESILARGVAIREQRDTVVGQVLEKGLAGWVYRQREVGLVTDTATDDRWLELPNQPYVAKSILCVPVIRGSHLLAIATLMHSQVGFFDQEKAILIEMCAARIAMVLDLLRLQVQGAEDKQTTQANSAQQLDFKAISQLVLAEDGRLLYGDPRLGEIFEYYPEQLHRLDSFFELVADTHQEVFARKVAHCLEGNPPQLLVMFRGVTQSGKSRRIEFYGQRTKLNGQMVMVARLRVL